MVGVALLIPFVFLRISILLFANLKSMSSTTLFVLPSITTSLGAIWYPLPKELIATESIWAKRSILRICGYLAVGDKVLSEGNL